MLTEHESATSGTPGGCAEIPYSLPTFGKRARRKLLAQAHASELPSPSLPRLLTVKEVAGWLRTSDKAVYAMNDRGQLPGVVRVGRNIRVVEAELLHWVRHKSTAITERIV